MIRHNCFCLLTAICVVATSGLAQGELIDKVAAVVGNEIILTSEVELGALQATEGQPVNDQIRGIVLEQLMFEKLLLNKARLDSVDISDAQVDAEIEQRLQYFVGLLGSEEAFVEYYGKSIPAWRDDLRDDVRHQLMARQTQQVLGQNVSITPAEVVEFFEAIPADSLPLIPEEIAYSQIAIDPKVGEFAWEETRLKLDSIRGVVSASPSRMGLEAAKWSLDPGSKYNGGCYPLMRKGTSVPEYEAAVFTTPIGECSEVFQTDFGYHFVYVKDRRGNLYEACHILLKPEVTDQAILKAEAFVDSLVNEIRTDTLTFRAAAQLFSDDEKTAAQEGRVINPATGSRKFQVEQLDPKLFFVLDKLEIGLISEPLFYQKQDANYTYLALQLNERTEAHIANLEDDYLIFQEQALGVKQQDNLEDWVRKRLVRTYVRIEPEYASFNFDFPWLEYQVEENETKP